MWAIRLMNLYLYMVLVFLRNINLKIYMNIKDKIIFIKLEI